MLKEKPNAKYVPQVSSKLRHHILRVPSVVRNASGIVINGRRIKSLVFTTDIAIIRNCNADAVLAVYPFTPQPTISSSVLRYSWAEAPLRVCAPSSWRGTPRPRAQWELLSTRPSETRTCSASQTT